MNLTVFIGWDSHEPMAFHVLRHSIESRSSQEVKVIPLMQGELRRRGIYVRERGSLESTEFSLTRFMVPYLSDYEGTSIFMDCDMLCLTDINSVLSDIEASAAVSVCKHNYLPKTMTKFLDQRQTIYPKKNWSSFMVFNNELCSRLTPEYVNTASGLELHQFKKFSDEEIGSLPLDWNWLVGEYPKNPNAKILHYTLGGPWFKEYSDCDYADEWLSEYKQMIGDAHGTRNAD